jgi:hypothetical protein
MSNHSCATIVELHGPDRSTAVRASFADFRADFLRLTTEIVWCSLARGGERVAKDRDLLLERLARRAWPGHRDSIERLFATGQVSLGPPGLEGSRTLRLVSASAVKVIARTAGARVGC